MIAEFKLKVPGEPWETTSVFLAIDTEAAAAGTGISEEHVAHAIANGLSRAYGTEARWNWEDSRQGNYSHPEGTLPKQKVVTIEVSGGLVSYVDGLEEAEYEVLDWDNYEIGYCPRCGEAMGKSEVCPVCGFDCEAEGGVR